GGGVTTGRNHLSAARKLFKQTEPLLFSHEQIHRFHLEDNLTIDPDYYRFRHTYAGDPRYVDVTSVDVLHPTKRANVLRKLLVVREIERRVAEREVILNEAALTPVLKSMFDEDGVHRKELNALAKSRLLPGAKVLASASTADLARQGADDDDKFFLSPSARAALEWHRKFRASGRNVLVLAGNYAAVGAKCKAVDPRVQKHIDAALKVSEFSGTRRNRYDGMSQSINKENQEIEALNKERLAAGQEPLALLEVPTFHVFKREARKLTAFENAICSYGVTNAVRKFTALGSGLDIRGIGERVEMDGWHGNLKTILELADLFDVLSLKARGEADRLNIWLIDAIDCGSRVVLGRAFSVRSNADAVLNARAQIGIDKTAIARSVGCKSSWHHLTGVQSLVADNGKEFTAVTVLAAEKALAEGAKVSTPAAMPQMKGTCESLFKRAAMKFRGTPGWSEMRQRLNKDFKAEEHAQLVLTELVALMINDTVDVYHHTPHRGLNGATPAAMWDALYEKRNIHPPASPSRRRVAFGIRLERTIGRHGVTVLGTDYQCEAIQKHFQKKGNVKVQVAVDRWDLGAVSVLIGTEFFVARPRRNINLRGVSIEALLEARRNLKARHDAKAKLTETIVNDALAHAQALFAQTAYRATVVLRPLTNVQLDALERGLGMSLAIEGDESLDPGALDRTFLIAAESFEAGGPPAVESDVEPAAIRSPAKTSRFVKE
ncbi:MAG: Mu transposase C-terminal domain-containing protein, partial [Phreatobacter sp.]|nr:Mu transposase C-terminal domain-containing protein [Phreatobacter sp.]